jgi:transcriptional regulator GlxA family with amidase domain
MPEKFRNIRMMEGEKFPHLTEGFLEKLDACENFEEAIVIFENRLRQTDFGASVSDEKVAEAVKLIEATGGEMKIAELAAELELSTRQLQRRFKVNSGLTPKQFARARRIRAAAVHLVENSGSNWADRAAETGFADQAHLAHEFVSVTKRSPNSFAEKVSHIKHGKLVK